MKVTLKNLETKENLRKHILKNGCFDEKKNARIYDKFFKNSPRYVFRAVYEKYNVGEKTVADVGCGYGGPLPFLKEGSYGVDYEGKYSKFARSIGLTIHERDLIEDETSDLPKVDAVWNSAVMEHVDSPHILLRKMYNILKPGGLLLLFVPTIPLFPIMGKLPKIGKYFVGYTHGDHVSAYTPRTLKFFCEHAGFETIEVSHFYPGLLSIFNRIPLIDGVIYVGRKKDNWNYPDNASREKADNVKGYTIRGNI